MSDEVSLSHFLRDRNSFVRNGWAYGEALAHFILDKDLLQGSSPHIVEVGCGLGDLAATAIPVFRDAGKELQYTMVDLSLRLQGAQRKRTEKLGVRIDSVRGDGEKIDKLVEGCDLLICNEALADFRTITNIPLTRGGQPTGNSEDNPKNQKVWGAAWDMIERYGLKVPPTDVKVPPTDEHRIQDSSLSFALNYGAIKFIEALQRILPPGGNAFIAEHMKQYAEKWPLFGHTEHSISTSHLERVFDALGFKWETGKCDDFLQPGKGKRMVDFMQVNLWLMMGKNPYENADEASKYLDMMNADPMRYMKLDKAVTLDEFRELARREGWNIGTPVTTRLGTDKYTYYLLRKPEPNVNLMEMK